MIYALIDGKNKDEFIKSPVKFAARYNIELSKSESSILKSTTKPQIEAILNNYDVKIDDKKRRAFLQALALGTLTGSVLSLNSCEGTAIGEGPDIKILSTTMNSEVEFNESYSSSLEFKQASGVVEKLSVHVSLRTKRSSNIWIELISPSDLRILLEEKENIRSINKWYGFNGELTKESLSILQYENTEGVWKLNIRVKGECVLREWGIEVKERPDTRLMGNTVNFIYGSRPEDSGCSC